MVYGWLAWAGKVAAAYFIIAAMLLAATVMSVDRFLSSDTLSLEVHIPPLQYKGWGQLWLTYPGGHLYATIPLDGKYHAVKFKLNASEVKARASKALDSLREHGVVEYASIRLVAYLVNDKGELCISTYQYSTLDYYTDKVGSRIKAAELAKDDPLALLEAGSLIVDSKRMTECVPVGNRLDRLAKGYNATGITGGLDELRSVPGVPQPPGVEVAGLPKTDILPCEINYIEIYFPVSTIAGITRPQSG